MQNMRLEIPSELIKEVARMDEGGVWDGLLMSDDFS
jgi:hypothetical protein